MAFLKYPLFYFNFLTPILLQHNTLQLFDQLHINMRFLAFLTFIGGIFAAATPNVDIAAREPEPAKPAQDKCGYVRFKGIASSLDIWKNDRCLDLFDIVDTVNIDNDNGHDCEGNPSWSGGYWPHEQKIPDSASFYCLP
ncbi:hypothetical protein BS50DRAFT_636961 [Corynespora cassiicola Philippines]|uniref:Uncharacterized protein n=1 Tax=Corynespora cassiicola Philippines TaxID=1448308 RepID=A0A2T2NDQ4_CORCC|nr:hypothetical protein BS50DRAFT_636961 [Corynespora cassiicola Philippines]